MRFNKESGKRNEQQQGKSAVKPDEWLGCFSLTFQQGLKQMMSVRQSRKEHHFEPVAKCGKWKQRGKQSTAFNLNEN